MPDEYTTQRLAAAAGYSVQQVRDLERLGVIGPATRRSNGYRVFTPAHLRELRAYRALATAAGPVVARATMRDARLLPYDEAVARVSALHVALARAREETLAALRALDVIADEAGREAEPLPADALTITELAGALAVRASTLRFWELEGLITPDRPSGRAARRYPPGAVREARIVAALRAGGYRIPEVRAVMTSLREAGGVRDGRRALQSRLEGIASRTEALLRAGADLADVLTPATRAAGGG
jgi:DNA-binding transcriptional MerR regulator